MSQLPKLSFQNDSRREDSPNPDKLFITQRNQFQLLKSLLAVTWLSGQRPMGPDVLRPTQAFSQELTQSYQHVLCITNVSKHGKTYE